MADRRGEAKRDEAARREDPVASGHDASDRESLVGDTAASERLADRQPVAPPPVEDRERTGVAPAVSEPPDRVRD